MAEHHQLALALGEALKQQGHQLALAESCTGGMVAEAVTSVAGSSQWFECGFVTYSNQSKIDMLNVLPETLAQHGAVSEQVAIEMAQGALQNSQADVAGSITGIAGPGGGTAQKPVGMVCIAWATRSGIPIKKTYAFKGDRQAIRMQACIAMMQGLLAI